MRAANSPNSMLHQYTRGFVSESANMLPSPTYKCRIRFVQGHTRLVQALSVLYSKLIDRKIDPFNEILVTSGAYEALYTAIQGFVNASQIR